MRINRVGFLAIIVATLGLGLVSLRPAPEARASTSVRVPYIPHPGDFITITDSDPQPFVVPADKVLVLTGGHQPVPCPPNPYLFVLRNGQIEARVDGGIEYQGPISFHSGEAVSLRGNYSCGRRVFGYLADTAPAPAPLVYFPHPASFVTIRQEEGPFTVPAGKSLLLMSAFVAGVGPYGPYPNLEVRLNGSLLTGPEFPPGYTDPEIIDVDKMRSVARAGDVVETFHPAGFARVCAALVD